MALQPQPTIKTLRILPTTDGDSAHAPSQPGWQIVRPAHPYLEKLASLWMTSRGMPPDSRTRYYLDRLPEGYTLYARARPSNAKIVDKHLYGHPSGRFFDSPNRFAPHFLHLMAGGGAQGCACAVCKAGGRRGSGMSLSTPVVLLGAESSDGSGRGVGLRRGGGVAARRNGKAGAAARSGGDGSDRVLLSSGGGSAAAMSSSDDASRGRREAAVRAQAATTSQYNQQPRRQRPAPTENTGPGLAKRNAAQPTPAARRMPPGLTRTRDEEGTPDTLRYLIDRLEKESTLTEQIKEPLSMDWRAEHAQLDTSLASTSHQKAWIPRQGEVVLFIRRLDGDLCYDGLARSYRLWDDAAKSWTGYPIWEAGVVGQVAQESLSVQDILEETQKAQGVNYSGFRIEPMSDPSTPEKSLSGQYCYVPMHHIRPFAYWREFLAGVPSKQWHASIRNALKVMSSISVVGRYKFKGTWPSADIFCHGVWLGAELLVVGDAVRIMSVSEPSIADDTAEDEALVLHVKSIRLRMTNLDKASSNDYDSGHPYNSSVVLCGKAYTLSRKRAFDTASAPIDQAQLPPGMQGYSNWRLVHAPEQQMQAPFWKVAGRCFEAEAVFLWLPGRHSETASSDYHTPSLSIGYDAIAEAREYSARKDKRLLDGKSFYWGDSRAECLNLVTLNGASLSAYDESRDPDEYQNSVRVMEKMAGAETMQKQREDTGGPKVGGSGAMGMGLGDLASEEEDSASDGEDDSAPVIAVENKKASAKLPLVEIMDLTAEASRPSSPPNWDIPLVESAKMPRKRSHSVADTVGEESSGSLSEHQRPAKPWLSGATSSADEEPGRLLHRFQAHLQRPIIDLTGPTSPSSNKRHAR